MVFPSMHSAGMWRHSYSENAFEDRALYERYAQAADRIAGEIQFPSLGDERAGADRSGYWVADDAAGVALGLDTEVAGGARGLREEVDDFLVGLLERSDAHLREPGLLQGVTRVLRVEHALEREVLDAVDRTVDRGLQGGIGEALASRLETIRARGKFAAEQIEHQAVFLRRAGGRGLEFVVNGAAHTDGAEVFGTICKNAKVGPERQPAEHGLRILADDAPRDGLSFGDV